MARTDATAVQEVLLKDYDSRNAPSLTRFINAASLLVNRVATCAANKGYTLSEEELEMIESWLAAHMYATSDRTLASKSTSGASGSFHGQATMRLEATFYGQTALTLDSSGCLEALNKRAVASFTWLGKPPSDQIEVDQRD